MIRSTNSPDENYSSANVRTEYTALANYFNNLISFRLTLMGFFLASIGFMASVNWPMKPPVAFLGILLTGSLYLFELRTRILFNDLAKRGIEIEQLYWKSETDRSRELPFFSRQFPQYLEPFGMTLKYDCHDHPIKILGFITIRSKLVSHSFSLDLLYVGILFYFIVAAVFSLIYSPSSPVPYLTPTATPTIAPSQVPTVLPIIAPSQIPTVSPTIAPSQIPTVSPTSAPSQVPTVSPTSAPS